MDLPFADAQRLVPSVPWDARAIVLINAICLQESGGRNIRQAHNGPASGYPQFEIGGIRAVLTAPATRKAAAQAVALAGIPPNFGGGEIPGAEGGIPPLSVSPKVGDRAEIFLNSPNETAALVHAKFLEFPALQIAFARLMLYANPKPLPAVGDRQGAWNYYVSTWRPGKPRPQDWPGNYAEALAISGEPK